MNELRQPDKVITINLPKVTKQSILITGFFLLILFISSGILEHDFSFKITLLKTLLFIVGYVVLIILHEFFHLLGFRIFSKVPWRKMIVGINLRLGIAYATTNVMMTNQSIRKSLLFPFWMTGIVPAIIGLYYADGVLIGLSSLLIGGAAGDFVMYMELKQLPGDWLVQDDPEKPTLYLFAPTTEKP